MTSSAPAIRLTMDNLLESSNCLAEYEFARLASEQSCKKYTVFGISQKLARNSIKYDEMKFFAKVLGYDLMFEKIEE